MIRLGQEREDAMVEVTFDLHPSCHANGGSIVGDFNSWMPASTPMHTNGAPGQWVTKLPLAPGRYRYRLVVDGKWMTDPNNKYVETNQFGELNNVIDVA